MKKLFCVFLIITIFIQIVTYPSFAQTNIIYKELTASNDISRINLNDNRLYLKDINGKIVNILLIDGTTYLPVRAICEVLGLNVEWDDTNKAIYLTDGNINESLFISDFSVANKGNYIINAAFLNIQIYLRNILFIPKDANGNIVEPFIVDGTTYLPLRAVCEALNLDVYWHDSVRTISLTTPDYPEDKYITYDVPSFTSIVKVPPVSIQIFNDSSSVSYLYLYSEFDANIKLNCQTLYNDLLNKNGYKYFSSNKNAENYETLIYINYEKKYKVEHEFTKSSNTFFYNVNITKYIGDLYTLPAETQPIETQPIETQPVPGSAIYDFPFHLYSNDGEYNYLGKLVTDKYDRDGIWNEYGTYGSEFKRGSIWNEFGDYGGEFSRYSPFNKYTRTAPIIVDDRGEIFGYLTANDFTRDGYTILELYAFLVDNGQ